METTMEYGNDYYAYPHPGWWKTKKEIAGRMTVASLNFSIRDCFEAGQAMPVNLPKYSDEASIYRMELERRNMGGKCRCCGK